MHTTSIVAFVVISLCSIGCGSDTAPETKKSEKQTRACTEPENPYSQGSGHYAGYEWAERHGGNCNGRSQSFNEGCEEYEEQEAEYEECQKQE
jgi:hypothetical protein